MYELQGISSLCVGFKCKPDIIAAAACINKSFSISSTKSFVYFAVPPPPTPPLVSKKCVSGINVEHTDLLGHRAFRVSSVSGCELLRWWECRVFKTMKDAKVENR